MGQTPLPSTPEPPGPPNPPAPGFPRLRETFKSGLGRRRVLLISSGRSTPAPSRAICSAPRPTKGQGTRSPRGDPAPSRPQPRAQQGSGEQGMVFFPAHRLEGSGSTEFAVPPGSSSIPKPLGIPKAPRWTCLEKGWEMPRGRLWMADRGQSHTKGPKTLGWAAQGACMKRPRRRAPRGPVLSKRTGTARAG